MKKYLTLLLLSAIGTSGVFAAEDMRFVTTLSAPLAVFDKVETSTAAEPAKAAKATVGVLSSGAFNTTLKLNGKDAKIHTMQMEKNSSFSSSSVPIWKTPRITVNKGGALTGKRLQATSFEFKGTGINTINSTNADVTSNISALTGTATETLNIKDKDWYQTVHEVPVAGQAAWGSITAGSDGTKTFTNILNYNSRGPTSTGSTTGKWKLVGTKQYTSCSAGSVLRDSCLDSATAGRTGNGLENVSCTGKCGVSCVYIPCVNNIFQEYTYTCTC